MSTAFTAALKDRLNKGQPYGPDAIYAKPGVQKNLTGVKRPHHNTHNNINVIIIVGDIQIISF
jgi:hypothetical protein